MISLRTAGTQTGQCFIVGGAVHRQLAHVFLGLEDNYVHLWGEQTQEGDIGRQRDRYTQGSCLYLKKERICRK